MRHHQTKWAAMIVVLGIIAACVVFALVRM
jgi:hypothetical protein